MTLTELYQLQSEAGQAGNDARELLAQTHWFAFNAEFDPKTGDALPQPLSAFLTKIASGKNVKVKHDRLYRIREHARPSILRLFRSLNENPRREHAFLPVRAVRELDASSFIKLSTRPGRNIREKLAGKPYLQAVRRFQSVDLTENRLLKAFVTRLLEMLELRHKCVDEAEDELVVRIQSWMNTDEAHAISPWNNLPPNNTLLSHRDYRRIWDAWRWLQSLDDDIARDFSQLDDRQKTMQIWNQYAQMYREGTHYFADMPILFAYEDFKVEPWTSTPLTSKVKDKIKRFASCPSVTQPTCIDLAYLHPQYATTTSNCQENSENYLWQEWSNEVEAVTMGIFDSDAAHLHPNTTTISLPDLLFSHDYTYTEEHLDRAAQAFTNRLNKRFQTDQLLWLVPDALNDFDLEIVRRNINARFPNAQPLPRSVAAVFEQVDYTRLKIGFAVVVIDTIGGATTATKLIARSDPKLKKRIPETKGFYWERCPTIILSRDKYQASQIDNLDMIAVDADGKWHNKTQPLKSSFIDQQTLRHDSRIGQFAFVINISRSPVAGGVRLYGLQQQAEDIALWRDHLPQLTIRIVRDGHFENFYLVKDATVTPQRDRTVNIPVEESFTLPAGQPYYSFPLQQGAGNQELNFVAYLKSPAFPLKEATTCKLKMTYTYGDDDPYELKFIPMDSEKSGFKSIRVEWRSTSEGENTDLENLPVPDFPARKSWSDFQNFPRKDGKSCHDLLEWVEAKLVLLDSSILREEIIRINVERRMSFLKRTRVTGIFKWGTTNNKGNYYCFVDIGGENIYCSASNFTEGVHTNSLYENQVVYLNIKKYEDRSFGIWISFHDEFPTKIAEEIHEEESLRINVSLDEITRRKEEALFSLRFPVLTIWNHGHSLSESDVPDHFRNTIFEGIPGIISIIESEDMPEKLKEELFFFLCCLHKDTPKYVSNRLVEMSNDFQLLFSCHRNIALAIGSAGLAWQQELLNNMIYPIGEDGLTRSITMEILSIALWRSKELIFKLSETDLKKLCNDLFKCMQFDMQLITSAIPKQRLQFHFKKGLTESEAFKRERSYQTNTLCKHLELLLALLRIRGSGDESIKVILAPYKNLSKKYMILVDDVSRIVIDNNIELKSRINLQIEKPEIFHKTPDLLYALRMYLTGDNGANTIVISGISEDD